MTVVNPQWAQSLLPSVVNCTELEGVATAAVRTPPVAVATTEKATGLLGPFGLDTVTLCVPGGVAGSIDKMAVMRVGLSIVTPLTVTPEPLTETELPYTKFCPVMTTGTL